MSAVRSLYKIVRSILFTAVLIVVGFYALLYVMVSLPPVQRQIKKVAEEQLSLLLKAPLSIGEADIRPFNELILKDVDLKTPEGKHCVSIDRLGAGIAFWKLVLRRKIEITYAEIIGLDGEINQQIKDGPLNIQFIIDAFKPKKKAPPTKFDLKLHNIVIRKSALRFDRLWLPEINNGAVDPNHVRITELKADVALPRLKNDDFEIDLRRLSFKEGTGLYLDRLSAYVTINEKSLAVRDLVLKIGDSELTLNNQQIDIDGFASIGERLKTSPLTVRLKGKGIQPLDFSPLYPPLASLSGSYDLDVHAEGTLDDITLRTFKLESEDSGLYVYLRGVLKGLPDIGSISGAVSDLDLRVDASRASEILSIAKVSDTNILSIIEKSGGIRLSLEGRCDMSRNEALARGEVSVNQGDLEFDGDVIWRHGMVAGNTRIKTAGFMPQGLMEKIPIESVSLEADAGFSIKGKVINGEITASIPSISLYGNQLENISLEGRKSGGSANAQISVDCQPMNLDLNAVADIAGIDSHWQLNGSVSRLDTRALGPLAKYAATFSIGEILCDVTGNNADNMQGIVRIGALACSPASSEDEGKWNLDNIEISASGNKENRSILLRSDVADADLNGNFRFKDLPAVVTHILAYSLPTYIKAPDTFNEEDTALSLCATIKPGSNIYKAFRVPVEPLKSIAISADLDDGNLGFKLDAPRLKQGEKKQLRDTHIEIKSDIYEGTTLTAKSQVPVKNGYAGASISATALNDNIESQIGWTLDNKTSDDGELHILMSILQPEDGDPQYDFNIKESGLRINGTRWNVSPSHAMFGNKVLTVDNLRIGNDNQYLTINGRASASDSDSLVAHLNEIDLSYIFNTLNINYVTFGGIATGDAVVSELFTRQPKAATRNLFVKNLSYNNAVLGDADLSGRWDNENKAVGIGAYIRDGENAWGKVNGHVFISRDSLGFNFKTNKINLALIQPFLENVLENVQGRGTADLTLYGTFKDVTLVGKAYADTASVKLGFTNVTYTGADSVLFTKDKIIIPGFRVYDRYGKSCLFSGIVHHDYFHDARFTFDVKNIDNMLCYDTDAKINPFWYGRIFASGSGRVTGEPGYTSLNFNASTRPNSVFTFALDENETAADYTFLTFSDKKGEAAALAGKEIFDDETETKHAEEPEGSSVFEMDLGVNVTPDIKMNVIMDPSAGDKITATGSGAIRLHYDSQSDDIGLYGRYTLDEGNYQFSFQDLILRDFKINEGSSISFNGDPMRGILDITAGYRVNTNLTDLDKSFANDRDLNRSSIPVDALLKVSGNFTSPDIAFDISMPTVTSDVERRVRSVISSEEMMSQQVLYLLALNRFYTPPSQGGSDGELVSVASSTLSSQLSNIMSQITDKFSLSPSFKSDRNDFSDMEVDLALSSQLFDNRLIINGNLGYRDRSVSQTNFIGDFDIEYLLNRRGTWRLKAYNHFNDAYYYLKSALTTQGLGIVYRMDFNDAFSFLRKKRKKTLPDGNDKRPAEKETAVVREEKQ